MKLKRLVIQGFKSFKDRTIVQFDQGITGIVGPNGCGKSNIVDALFWIMGEQSAKHLRGNSMKDLIFAGSSKYSPGSFAEATLVLANTSGKHVHIGNKVSSPSEIQLTRKLFRNGETEYRINGSPCRLRDIQEVFMDTGAGAKSYSIIAQGEINRLVQAKPIERRTMIEEVAGITKFKMRRRESLRKIEATETNLGRLRDLQTEVAKNLTALRKQAEKAERARSLKEKAKRNELVMNSHKIFDFMRFLKDDRETIIEKREIVESRTEEKSSLEESLIEERELKKNLSKEIDLGQKEVNECSKKLAAKEERFNSLSYNKEEKQKAITQREAEIEELTLELDNRRCRLNELKAEEAELIEQQEAGFDFSELAKKVEQLSTDLKTKKESLEAALRELNNQTDLSREKEQIVFQNNSRLEEYAASLQDMTGEIEVLEEQVSNFSQSMANERNEAARLSAEATQLEEQSSQLKAELDQAKAGFKEKENSFKTQNREMIQVESRLESLREVKRSLEGGKAGTTAFLGQEEEENFSLLGNLLQCEERYTKAVQLVLQDIVNALVAKGEMSSLQSWLVDNREMGIDFIRIDSSSDLNLADPSETKERLGLKGFSNTVALSDIITLSKEYLHLEGLFSGIYIVDSIEQDHFNKLDSSMGFSSLVSCDGTEMVKNHRGSLHYYREGEQGSSMGMIERNNLIGELELRLTELKQTLENDERELELFEVKINELSISFDERRNLWSERKSEAAAKNSALESKVSSVEAGQARLEILQNRKKQISNSRFELIESEDEIAKELTSFKEKEVALKAKSEELKNEIAELTPLYDDNKNELIEKQVAAESFAQRLKMVQDQVVDLKAQVERQELRIENTIELVEKTKKEIIEIDEQLIDLQLENERQALLLEEEQNILVEKKQRFEKVQKEMNTREDRVRKIVQEMNQAEKKIIELEAKSEQYVDDEEFITRDIFEKHRVDLRLVLGAFLDYTDEDYTFLKDLGSMYSMETEQGTQKIEAEEYEFTRRYGQDLKDCEFKFKQYRNELKRLGEINWQAVEDFNRQKLRHDFLEIQEKELRKSLEDLETAIGHIDIKSKERFKHAFEEVNTRFEKVFPIIFGGGSAKLRVVGDINDAECGVEIIAQPPGKKMQNINLMSGGEKALTALSLIFSIFLVKPSPFCLLDEVDAPLDDANVGRFNELLREMSHESQFILITHNKKTMELNDTLYGVTMQEPGVSKAVSVQLQ